MAGRRRLDLRDDETIEELALRVAERGCMAYRHGCVIVAPDGTLLGVGFNTSTNGRIQHGMLSQHAEEAAIRNVMRRYGPRALVGATLYVFKLTRAGKSVPAIVCANCAARIARASIARVHYHPHPTGVHKNDTADYIAMMRRRARAGLSA